MALEFATLFPNGVIQYLLGGVLIGLATVLIYLGTGIHAGASTFLESTLSYVSDRDRFQQFRFVESRDWRLVFTAGIVLGAAAYTALSSDPWWTTEVSPLRLFVGGTLVGIGTRIGKGCTSGHGICGVGSLSEASLTNVLMFVLVAAGVAQLLMLLGVSP
ncbi:YeeE/YedE family protein [Halolamina sp.]|jgi:hypothetical protein|uniref:YeeE/YedE family protein n=1 Tax=Halolamina sp. TaxID=1940283 RepID=UPI000223B7C2|nr:protein of unknown function DUF395 YeeE/YedE [halophilic archaeon DL31]